MKIFSMLDDINTKKVLEMKRELEGLLNVSLDSVQIQQSSNASLLINNVWNSVVQIIKPLLKNININDKVLNKYIKNLKYHSIFSAYYCLSSNTNKTLNLLNVNYAIKERMGENSQSSYPSFSVLFSKLRENIFPSQIINLHSIMSSVCDNRSNNYIFDTLSVETLFIIIQEWKKCPYNPDIYGNINYANVKEFAQEFYNLLFDEYHPANCEISEALIHHFIFERIFSFSLFSDILRIPNALTDEQFDSIDDKVLFAIILELCEMKSLHTEFPVYGYFITYAVDEYVNKYRNNLDGWVAKVRLTIKEIVECIIPLCERLFFVILWEYFFHQNNFVEEADLIDRMKSDVGEYINTDRRYKAMVKIFEKNVQANLNSKFTSINLRLRNNTHQIAKCLYDRDILNDTVFKHNSIQEFLKIKQQQIVVDLSFDLCSNKFNIGKFNYSFNPDDMNIIIEPSTDTDLQIKVTKASEDDE